MRELPPSQLPFETDAERAIRLEAQVNLLEAENGVLRRYLNDIEKLTQRVLALRAGRGRLLVILIAAAILFYGSIPGTPLNRVLVAAWQAVTASPPRAHAYTRQPFYEAITDPQPTLSPAAVPSASMPLPTPAVPPTTTVIVNKPSPSPIPSPLPTCKGHHHASDVICPPMGHKQPAEA